MRTDELVDIIEWLGAVVRQTDSSLLDEWEQLSDPTRVVAPDVAPPAPENITANERAFTVLVRNALFRRVELAALRRWQQLGELEAATGSSMTAEAWHEALEEYFEEHDAMDTGPDARGPAMLVVEKEDVFWRGAADRRRPRRRPRLADLRDRRPGGLGRRGRAGDGRDGTPAGLSRVGSDEGAPAGDRPADDQRVDLAGALVGVDRLGVGHEASDVVLEQDAVATEHLARPAHRLAHP